MSIVFKQCPTVTSGSVPLASHMIGMADSINTRLRSGLADCTKRIHQYAFFNFRQFRNPDELNNFGSLGEFSMFYQMIEPEVATYPVAGPGESEGANLACPANQFVFGIEPDKGGTLGEGDGFTANTGPDFFNPQNSSQWGFWNLAKIQRGYYDDNQGIQDAPMLTMAEKNFQFAFPEYLKHHKTPGGYLPLPAQSDTPCHTTDTDPITGAEFHQYWPNYLYKWTRISDNFVIQSTGICGEGAGGSDTDIAYVWDGPFAWYLYFYNPIYNTSLPKSEWVMNLDGKGSPARQNGEQIQRLMVNPFIAEFRGTEFQRLQKCFDNPYIEYSFASQDFYAGQYQLAPASASWNGSTWTEIYPNWTLDGTILSASVTTATTVGDGYRVGGHYVESQFLSAPVTMSLMSGSTVLNTFHVSPTTASFIQTFPMGPTGEGIHYRFDSDCSFTDANGYIYIEQSHLWDYSPQVWDGYALIRLSTAKGPSLDQLDTRGTDWEYSREITNNYFKYGCLLNLNGAISVEQQEEAVNTNPVFDASRRYVNSYTRTINGTDMRIPGRPLLVGYEVSESYAGSVTSSKSILYFEKFHTDVGLTTATTELFSGMLNTEDSASNGIITTAPYQGYTNEWLMDMCTKPYHPDEDSIWEVGLYANYYPYINRCHILPDPLNEINPSHRNPKLFSFFQELRPDMATELREELYSPESLTAYNYDGSPQINKVTYDVAGDDNYLTGSRFYKSCQVYPKPYELESVQAIAGNRVKVVFSTRLQHTDTAPNIIANNVAGWDFDTVRAEEYRTDENALRLFLLKQYNNGYNTGPGYGDLSLHSWHYADVYAAIYPTFFFTKLISKPYVNDGIETTGSLDYSGSLPRAYDLQLVETYVKSICEGFVDGHTSETTNCRSDDRTQQMDYDYTFSSLCYDAFSGSCINNISTTIRSDNPKTFGPLPDMVMNTTVFNQLGSCINKLTKVRLPLPWQMQVRVKTYEDSFAVVPDVDSGGCSWYSSRGIKYAFVPPVATTLINTGIWTAEDSFTARTDMTFNCNGSGWLATVSRRTGEVRLSVQDELAWYALNDDLRGLVSGSNGSGGIYGFEDVTRVSYTVVETATPEQSKGCNEDANYWESPTPGLWFDRIETIDNEPACKYFTTDTEIDAGQLSVSDAAFGFSSQYGLAESTCGVWAGNTKTIGLVNKQHMIIIVPTI